MELARYQGGFLLTWSLKSLACLLAWSLGFLPSAPNENKNKKKNKNKNRDAAEYEGAEPAERSGGVRPDTNGDGQGRISGTQYRRPPLKGSGYPRYLRGEETRAAAGQRYMYWRQSVDMEQEYL